MFVRMSEDVFCLCLCNIILGGSDVLTPYKQKFELYKTTFEVDIYYVYWGRVYVVGAPPWDALCLCSGCWFLRARLGELA